ncbi:E3 ISG15--protein ligase HERC5 [Chlorella vulgaris]
MPGERQQRETARRRTALCSATFGEIGDHLFTQIDVGGSTSCGLLQNGSAFCWGSGGTLGNGAGLDSLVPVPVSGGHVFTQITVGRDHSCGLLQNSSALCWGQSGGNGQLGNGFTSTSGFPVPVTGDHLFSQISAGDSHSRSISHI